jgi:hypothetical protein
MKSPQIISQENFIKQLQSDIVNIQDSAIASIDKVIELGCLKLIAMSGIGVVIDDEDKVCSVVYYKRKYNLNYLSLGGTYQVEWSGEYERRHKAIKIFDDKVGDILVVPHHKMNTFLKQKGI